MTRRRQHEDSWNPAWSVEKNHVKDSQTVRNKILPSDESKIELFGFGSWQHHAVRVYFSSRDWSGLRESWTEKSTDIFNENLVQSIQDLRLDWRFTIQQDPNHTAKTTQEWLRENSLNVSACECLSQCSDLNPIRRLWRDLKIAIHWWSPSNLTELKICREWQEI